METTVTIDAPLLADAKLALGLQSDREVIELALKRVLALHGQAELRTLRGRIAWKGDLDALRRDGA